MDTVIKYSSKIIDLALPENFKWLNIGYQKLGQAYIRKGDYEKGLSYLFKALETTKSLTTTYSRGLLLLDLADAYSYAKDRINSSKYYREAIDQFSLNQSKYDSVYLTLSFINYSDDLLELQHFDSAYHYLKKAEILARKLKSKFNTSNYHLALITGNLGIIEAERGNLTMAEAQINEAIRTLRNDFEDLPVVSEFLTYIANLFIEKKEYEKARLYLKESLEIAEQQGLLAELRDIYLKLSVIDQSLGNYKEAFDAQSLYILYRDSINNEEVIQRMADQRTEFEVGQKQVEVDLLTAEKKIQQLMLFAAVGFSLILIILASIIYKYYQNKNKVAKILEAQKLELERVNATKDKFFSIISHDLRGPVASFFGISRLIKFLVESKETNQLIEVADDIDRSVERLSNLLDNLLNWAMQQQGHVPNVPEKLEFKYLAMDLSATFKTMADSKKINLKVDVEDNVQIWADRNMTMTIFRNLINNALKFTPEGGSVTLFAAEKDGMVFAGVKDTGVGIPKEKLETLFTLGEKKSTYGTSGEKGLGLGLQLVYEFIGLNNGTVQVESEPDKGTVFSVHLPAFATEQSQLSVS